MELPGVFARGVGMPPGAGTALSHGNFGSMFPDCRQDSFIAGTQVIFTEKHGLV